MEKIVVEGGAPLKGEVPISGAKNAALPILCAAILATEPFCVRNVPALGDVETLLELLGYLGLQSTRDPAASSVCFRPPSALNPVAMYDIVRKMRASVLVLGPLLSRCGTARVSLPGGCAIGNRPVDLHLQGLEAMGAKIRLEEGYIAAEGPAGGLQGCRFTFSHVSVGATENVMMAATLAKGTTVLQNCAKEPEIVNLGMALSAMGARIEGLGTATLTIEGRPRLGGGAVRIIPDRIETATYAIAAAMTGGDLLLKGACGDHLRQPLESLKAIGVGIEETAESLRVFATGAPLRGCDLETDVYPGFPTDMQAQFMSLLCLASSPSTIGEHIFENRFMHVPELQRMGAAIRIEGPRAFISPQTVFRGATVMASDLRASASLVLAALAAHGTTHIRRVYHLNRGYERLVEKLQACGGRLRRDEE